MNFNYLHWFSASKLTEISLQTELLHPWPVNYCMKVYGEAGPKRVYISVTVGLGKGLYFTHVGPVNGCIFDSLVCERVSFTYTTPGKIFC